MAQSKVTTAERAYRSNLSDMLLLLSAVFWFAGFCALSVSWGWAFTISLWLVAAYLFVGSVVQWARRR